MKYAPSLLLIFVLLHSCKEKETIVEKINFNTEYKLASEIESDVKNNDKVWAYQVSASDYATQGDYQNALRHWDIAFKGKEENYSEDQLDSINQKYRKISAREYIVQQAKETQIVIINEAHHNSLHRVFTKTLLQELYNAGYKNLGLEALSYKENLDSLQNIRKYPVQKTGYYTKDPQFGNLIREAIAIGYTLFPYETKDKEANGYQREIDQAKNIQQYMEQNPNEKFLIHCGFDHALEGKHNSWEKAMAARLSEYTGINPLTINQVAYSEKGNPALNHPLLKALNVEEPTVVLDKENQPFGYSRGEAFTDIAVFHPNTTYLNKRPDWLFNDEKKQVAITLPAMELEFPAMILAFQKSDDIDNAVPVDITQITDQKQEVSLGLEKGIYNIIVTNKKHSYKFQKEVE